MLNQSIMSCMIFSLSGSIKRSCRRLWYSLIDLSIEEASSNNLWEPSGSVTVSEAPWRTRKGILILLRFCSKYVDMHRISQPVLTLIEPVKTNGSEYLDWRASGSRETTDPLLFAALNWYFGARRQNIGARTCHRCSDQRPLPHLKLLRPTKDLNRLASYNDQLFYTTYAFSSTNTICHHMIFTTEYMLSIAIEITYLTNSNFSSSWNSHSLPHKQHCGKFSSLMHNVRYTWYTHSLPWINIVTEIIETKTIGLYYPPISMKYKIQKFPGNIITFCKWNIDLLRKHIDRKNIIQWPSACRHASTVSSTIGHTFVMLA